MSPPERPDPGEHSFEDDLPPGRPEPVAQPQRLGRWVGALVVLILVLILINTIVTKPNGSSGVPPGRTLPPFAVPLALASLQGAADVATRPNEGNAGKVPACELRGPQILNVCEQYEHAPLVLALFVDNGGCTGVLGKMQALSTQFPGVHFAAVALRGSRASLRSLVRKRGLTFPVGYDEEGTLAALYSVATCPQLSFALPGGVVHSRALLEDPSPATLRKRVEALVAAAVAGGRREPGG
ncbi:MAG TPA: hypothetical protein VHT27_00780 [Solirubrobacteraceae bacterium]|jgi:hypothetical protein|nr:hypothetical protein [Solirubrobacteraceae bacterium]